MRLMDSFGMFELLCWNVSITVDPFSNRTQLDNICQLCMVVILFDLVGSWFY